MPQEPERRRGVAASSVLILAGLAAVINPRPLRAQATPDAATVEELRRRIDERDAVIDNLLQRVRELEQRLGGPPPADAYPPPAPPDEPPPRPAAAAEESGPPARAAAAPAPGQFEVDEEAIERALERALVQTGALLLPVGRAEFQPRFGFTRRETGTPVFVIDGGQELLAERRVRTNEFTAGATLRLGLPFDSQLELDVPFGYEDISTATTVASAVRAEASRNISGFGDLAITFTRAVMRERGWRPDLFARVHWDTDTGQTDDGFDLGSGFHEIGGSVTAVKRQDPLVFVGTASYTTSIEDDGFDPGDEIGFSLGTVLAASPDTSLRFFLEQSFIQEAELRGRGIPGSDQVASSLFLGVSSVVGPRVVLDVSAGIGLTEDAPDYSITLSVPIRFDLPFF